MAELLTAEELAVPLKVSPLTVKRWAREGRIPAVWLSPTVRRFELEAVLAVVKRHRDPGSEGGGR
jgi:excisionase family DNA binding protein